MATRFWVGGTGTWDASTTTHWAATTGAAGGQTVPGTADSVTFDGSSGGGTVTVNTTVAVLTLTCGAFTGTLDFSAHNNNVTLSASGGFSGTGTGARTINLGDGTWTLSNAAATWNMTQLTGLVAFNANSSTIAFTGTANASSITFAMGAALTYSTVTVAATGLGTFIINNNAGAIISSLTLAAGVCTVITATSMTITTFIAVGTSSLPILLRSNLGGSRVTLAVTTSNISWCGLRDMNITFSSGAANSLDFGDNATIVITPPTAGGTMTRARGWSGFA
jgi:hypothetical protein